MDREKLIVESIRNQKNNSIDVRRMVMQKIELMELKKIRFRTIVAEVVGSICISLFIVYKYI